MKKNTKLINYFLFSLLIAFISCNNGEIGESYSLPQTGEYINLTAQEYASIAFDNPKELTETEAINIASSFVKAKESVVNEEIGTRYSEVSASYKVATKYYYGKDSSNGIMTKSLIKKEDEINIPIYELSIVAGIDTGLVIVSGDERAQKVLAYIPKTDETARKEITAARYLEELAKINLLDNITEIKKLQDSLRIPTLEKIADKLGLDASNVKFDEVKNYISVDDDPLSKFKPIQTPPSQVLSYVMPMCATQWNQTAPYNCHLPIGNVEGYSSPTNYYTGCGTVAIAQIVAFLEPTFTVFGTFIDWPYLKETKKIYNSDPSNKKDMIGYLIKHIYEKAGAYPVYNSSGYISGVATTESSIESCIKLYASCGSRQNWNSDIVRNSILANRPVATFGTGYRSDGSTSAHAFIIDGYLLCKLYYGGMSASISTETKELVKIYDLYFHANLGWGGNSDGYYLINKDISVDFETSGSTYSTGNLRILPSIVKK